MNDYTFTITTTLSGDTRQEAWDAWIEFLRDPNKVEAYTVTRSHEYDAVDRCKHCGKVVHNEMHDGFTFVIDDETGGDVCGSWGTYTNEPHEVDEPTGFIKPVQVPRAPNQRPT